MGGAGGRGIGNPGGEEEDGDEEEMIVGVTESLATLLLTTSPRVGMLLRGRDECVVSAADADLTMSLGGEYLVEIGRDDLPTSALREGDFSLGGRTTRSFGGELRGSSRSGGNGFGFSWGGGGLGASWGGDNRDLSRYCGGVFDLSLEEV